MSKFSFHIGAREFLAVFLIIVNFLMTVAYAKELSLQEIKKSKAEINKLQSEINQLNKRLKIAVTEQLKTDIQDKIDLDQAKIAKIKNILYPRVVKPARVEAAPSFEAVVEETGITVEVKKEERKTGVHNEVGAAAGFFAGTTALLGEVRVPIRIVLGPATTTFRFSTGLTQTTATDRRIIPVNFDAIFNFPPGWFSGVENYLGFGLNYVALTSGRKQGTVGGQVFYGVQSEGFSGIVFGELGFGTLRADSFSCSGAAAMVGFREPMWF